MSPRRPERRPPAAARARVRTAAPLRALTVVALGLLAFLAWRSSRHGEAPRVADGDLRLLDARTLIARATALVDKGQSHESLPIYRRLLVMSAGLNPSVRCAYAVAIYNSLFEADTTAGIVLTMGRTSDARVALMNECDAQLDTAIALARTSGERAGFEVRLATMLSAWGFQWDANDEFQRAARDDPGNADFARMVRDHREELRDPMHAPPASRLLEPAARGGVADSSRRRSR